MLEHNDSDKLQQLLFAMDPMHTEEVLFSMCASALMAFRPKTCQATAVVMRGPSFRWPTQPWLLLEQGSQMPEEGWASCNGQTRFLRFDGRPQQGLASP